MRGRFFGPAASAGHSADMVRTKRLVAALVAVTVLLLVVDLARPAWTSPLRNASAAVFSPIHQVLRGWDDDDLRRVELERDHLDVQVQRLRAERDAMDRGNQIEVPAGAPGERVIGARVVAVAPVTSPVAALMVTIDRGTADGVRADRTVVNSAGLVGRVLRVRPNDADVLLIGDPDLVVGVRFGAQGALGSISARPAPGVPTRQPGELTLTVIGDSPVEVGDEVTTLGSPNSSPFVADVMVATVVSVDPDKGQLGQTAAVMPSVDIDTLDAVAVLVGARQ